MKTKTWVQIKKEFLKDKELAKAYKESESEFELAKMVIAKRLEKEMTQKQLADKIGTKQAAISRLESGDYNPSLLFLRKVARGLDAKLKVSFK